MKGLGTALKALGQLSAAAEYATRAIALSITAGDNRFLIGENYSLAGSIALSAGRFRQGRKRFRCMRNTFSGKQKLPGTDCNCATPGLHHLAAGNRKTALKHFQKAIPRVTAATHIHHIVAVVSGLEATYRQTQAFRAFCHRYRTQHPEVKTSRFAQWFLEPAKPHKDCGLPILDDSIYGKPIQSQNPEWSGWTLSVTAPSQYKAALTIHAVERTRAMEIQPERATPRAPDFRRRDCTNVCEPALPLKKENPPSAGSCCGKTATTSCALIAVDSARTTSSFRATGRPTGFIRAWATATGDDLRIFLRLNGSAISVRALCSADGARWFTVGHIDFPVADPIQVGVFAIGNIDRAIYRGAYPEGTAIRFTSFQLWATIQQSRRTASE